MDYDAFDSCLTKIFQETQQESWIKPVIENQAVGVCLRIEPGAYRVFPYDNPYLAEFESAVRGLNPFVAVKTRNAVVHTAWTTVSDTAEFMQIDANTKIQILETMSHLPFADKEQCGAFIRDERVLVVWADDIDLIIPLCNELDDKIFALIWKLRPLAAVGNGGSVHKDSNSTGRRRKSTWSWKLAEPLAEVTRVEDPEKVAGSKEARPVRLFAPLYGGLSFGLSLFFVGSGIARLLAESTADHTYTRWALLACSPFLFCVSLFFASQIIVTISFLIGPVAQFHENSRYFSAIKPIANPEVDSALPHITIEMPVYKESLEQTIAPSIFSVKKAMQTYARQGGTSSIFVHDDGLQLLNLTQQAERIAFYDTHSIGYVARPGEETGVFSRAGRFKKASNMNFGIELSLKMEKHLAELEAHIWAEEEKEFWKEVDGKDLLLEDRALNRALEELHEENGKTWKAIAGNGKSLRMGEIVLLVDSDTIVPGDCFRDAARELAECPDVAIIQHESDVMQVAHHYFENGITHFTRRVNKVISMSCANGEVAPFVGHNAFLRWSAMQEAAFPDEQGKTKWWSEANVSEDFDMALRLMKCGYNLRWAIYSDGGFKEGVSLTVDDELNRWQKYAYGSNELIFNPFVTWFHRGPINKQLRIFVWSRSAPLHYKVSMLAYMFSYYGIAAGAMMSLINYVLLGFAFNVDGFYLHSFEIWLSCSVVFLAAGNVSYAVLVYRLGLRGLLPQAWENLTWIPFLFCFFGGISIHLSTALIAHLVSYNITWGATAKEVERSNFFIEVPRILKRFWVVFLICLVTLVGMIVVSTSAVPPEWRVPFSNWAVVFPLMLVVCTHLLFPVVLNPYLMVFSY